MAKMPESSDEQARAMDEVLGQHLADKQAAAKSAATASSPPSAEDLESLQTKAAERDEFLSLLQHTRADFANYQKRIQKEIESTRRFACQPVVADLLPGLDNLERALASTESTPAAAGLLDGIRMVRQQLLDALGRHGVRAIDALGKPFNPEFHEALMEQPSSENPPGTVIQELQKGYCLHDRVIRPARVIVSKA